MSSLKGSNMYLMASSGTFDHLLGKRVGRGYPEAPSYKPTHHLPKNAQSLPWAPIFLTLASEHDDFGFLVVFRWKYETGGFWWFCANSKWLNGIIVTHSVNQYHQIWKQILPNCSFNSCLIKWETCPLWANLGLCCPPPPSGGLATSGESIQRQRSLYCHKCRWQLHSQEREHMFTGACIQLVSAC